MIYNIDIHIQGGSMKDKTASMNELNSLHQLIAIELTNKIKDTSLDFDEKIKAIEAARKFLKDNDIKVLVGEEGIMSDLCKTVDLDNDEDLADIIDLSSISK